MAISKELLRQIIKENDLKSASDVYALLKIIFKYCWDISGIEEKVISLYAYEI